MARAHDLRLVRKCSKMKAFMDRVQQESPPMAPPLIVANDIDFFFVDDAGIKYNVEMRGERLEKGIYLKAKDIGKALGYANLANDIQSNIQLVEGDDYKWFTIPSPEKEKHRHSSEVFLTYTGMLAAVFMSKLPVAKKFRKWMSETVFAHHLGTLEQKEKAARSLLNKKVIDELTKRCENDMSCVYLVETERMLPSDSSGLKRKVYKFGYSKKMNERMAKFVGEHGRDCVINTLILLPEDCLSKAETYLKDILGTNYRYHEGTSTELLLLAEDERKRVQAAMRTVGQAFFGSTVVHFHELEMLKKSHELELLRMKTDVVNETQEKLKNDHERTLEKLKNDHERTLEMLKKNHELELHTVRAQHKAELAEKDRAILISRIRELEENAAAASSRAGFHSP
ncbi:hypothetical protein HDU96_004601 [Phlyctochytrium bullatum]|nr:hypothetical protein HDU96_004601 [Phlyctochytrium bullatum]